MIEYKVLNPEAEELEKVIEKQGHTHEFSVKAVRDQLVDLEKQMKESVAQIILEDSKVSNYKEHYPVINDLTEEQINAVRMYYDAMLIKVAHEKKLDKLKEIDEEVKAEMVEIEKQTGVKI